ncbi:hypothetical protein [Sulfurospirillum multivorans]|uniref:Membrane protein n=2 Tax=Sulfurospirillum multivorans TaxID=66821 RepID=A0AA86DXR2_SULMK|nr:hypothetical protein [Sulfurospirillum multivorans]AHJ12338.1 putative membrane protein [Sulfurospirillum multivorans DSM 12446]AHJ13248.1 hypothetical protein SMUL_1993 [Sulfurospirillum multivorans DSM 12446]QEH06737.1 hypothetical protein SMN_1972 [Sulfurospirillum multivorans]
MLQKIKEQFFGWLYVFVFFSLLFTVFFGRDIYDYYFAPNPVQQYVDSYEKAFGKKMQVPELLKQYVKDKQ